MSAKLLNDLLSAITIRGRRMLDREGGWTARDGDIAIAELAETILSQSGEASSRALARQLLVRFETLPAAARTEFFLALLTRFGPDRAAVDAAIAAYRTDPSEAHACGLHTAAEPRRQALIRRLNSAPGGAKALVEMRAALIAEMAQHPELVEVDRDFEHLLSSWFNRGFLVLERIDWSTPAAILEKIIRYEAVHAIHDWDELRRRIDPCDRHCLAFFHPALVDDPLIFVEVALTKGMPDAIAPILAEGRTRLAAEAADTAVFYSISNCQKGLKGISFGNFLIKQVVDELARDLPNLERFVTLSPAPTFMRWLKRRLRDDSEGLPSPGQADIIRTLEQPGWHAEPTTADSLRRIVMPLAADYFLHAKRADGQPVDPVTRFHLGNGARLERINWLADTSPRGLAGAGGMMVNYLYERRDIERNHEAYFSRNRIVASNGVMKLLERKAPSRALVTVNG